jgi:2-oxoglutarate ferredoxin oxidoreductase subunit beta
VIRSEEDGLKFSYRNGRPYPFCPGCGHTEILDHLDRALSHLQIDPTNVVIVSDIGCSGLSDQFFATNAFHGLHGRSITYASGIKLQRPELTVIVIMGDGGTGIGGAHLLSAARRNMGITVLVLNNFNFGMTGGQHSSTTPFGAITSTTPYGNLERPLDVCATVAVNGAGYAYRGTSFDADLDQCIAEAIRNPGFSLLDIWEPCTAYYVPANRLSRKALHDMLEELGFEKGLVCQRSQPEYTSAYRAFSRQMGKSPPKSLQWMKTSERPSFSRRFELVIAGSAGGRVGSAARLIAQAAILSGLRAAQRADYPVTVKTGFSLAELVLSPESIEFAGVTQPDAVLILSEEGRLRAKSYLESPQNGAKIFGLAGVPLAVPDLPWLVIEFGEKLRHELQALAALAAIIDYFDLIPLSHLEKAARLESPQRAKDDLQALGVGSGARIVEPKPLTNLQNA